MGEKRRNQSKAISIIIRLDLDPRPKIVSIPFISVSRLFITNRTTKHNRQISRSPVDIDHGIDFQEFRFRFQYRTVIKVLLQLVAFYEPTNRAAQELTCTIFLTSTGWKRLSLSTCRPVPQLRTSLNASSVANAIPVNGPAGRYSIPSLRLPNPFPFVPMHPRQTLGTDQCGCCGGACPMACTIPVPVI